MHAPSTGAFLSRPTAARFSSTKSVKWPCPRRCGCCACSRNGEITRIGGDAAIPVDVRVIAASNKDLSQAVTVGEFRRDLYHRLKVVELHIPAVCANAARTFPP